MEFDLDDEHVDPNVSCSRCDAVCCRLTVVVMPEDGIPSYLLESLPSGLTVMARGEDGWCVALDHGRMCCGIYESRPEICRKFAMGSAFCRSERAEYSKQTSKQIGLTVID